MWSVERPSRCFTGAIPHDPTKITSKRYGIHARNTFRVVSVAQPGSASLGFQTRHSITNAAIAINDDSMSVRYGPTKFETRNCVPANATPQVIAAGITPANPRQPPSTSTRYAGMNNESGAHTRPTFALRLLSGSPVIPASVTSGMPIAPNATGAVLASRQIAAARNGGNPKPASMEAAIATGVPNPVAPSRNAPNANAINKACSRWSPVKWPTELLIISNWPVSTVRL